MLKVSEVFTSVEGEVTGHHQGRITSFIRMYGCNLNCSYCDTEYSKEGGKYEEVDPVELAEKVPTQNVTITGGEPLLQEETVKLVSELVALGKLVSIETNGSIEIPTMLRHERISVVMDHKIPADFFTETVHKNNFLTLTSKDVVKFVIWNRAGFEFALKQRCKYYTGPKIAMSACEPYVNHAQLLDWILGSELAKDPLVILNIQLHKLIGAK